MKKLYKKNRVTLLPCYLLVKANSRSISYIVTFFIFIKKNVTKCYLKKSKKEQKNGVVTNVTKNVTKMLPYKYVIYSSKKHFNKVTFYFQSHFIFFFSKKSDFSKNSILINKYN